MAKLPSSRRQKRQHPGLKDLASAVEAAAKAHSDDESPTQRKEHSTLLDEHERTRDDGAGYANTSPTAQAESTLLNRADDDRSFASRDKQRGFRRSTQLLSSAFPRRGQAKSSASHNLDGDSNQLDQEPIRRSLEPPTRQGLGRPTLCSMISSSRLVSSAAVLGTLRVPTTETQLPLLDAQAQSALSVACSSDSPIVEITIRRSDELPYGAYSAPIVRLHVVDKCTGRSLQPPTLTGVGHYRNARNFNNAFWWKETLKLATDVHDTLSPRTVLLFEIVEERKTRHDRSLHGAKFEALQTSQSEIEKGELDDGTPPILPSKVKRIAWGFFHGITDHGGLTVPQMISSRSETSISNPSDVRLQLFQYQIITWMDQYQAKRQWGWRKSHPTVPAVFLQYQKRFRASAPATLFIRVGVAKSRPTSEASSLAVESALTSNVLNPPVDNGDHALPPVEENTSEARVAVQTEAQPAKSLGKESNEANNKPDWVAICKRDKLEASFVPQRVLHSLPSGKQGCSALAFSPCGHFLAAGVRTSLGDCHLNVYNVNTGARLCVGRGHGGIVYSLEWSDSSSDQSLIVSASSDGTARVWQIIIDMEQPNGILSLCEWHHVPAPIHVYCAIFHPLARGVVATGASDGHVRFYSENFGALPIVSTNSKLKVSDSAIHSIRIDTTSQRLFCGDGQGVIFVYSCTCDQMKASSFTRLKSIATGQSSITSLQLHPRKSHLLVHGQPNTLLQYELRSYLLLSRGYAGIVCEQTLGRSVFSPDGKWVASGTEDGTPRLFTSLHGDQIVRGLWGTPFFYGTPISDVAWSPTAHMVALCSYSRNSPIVVLAATREDGDSIAEADTNELWSRAQRAMTLDNNDDPILGGNDGLAGILPPVELPADDHTRRVQQILERRRKRLEAQKC